MKIFSLGGVLTLSAVASLAAGANPRLTRDVSELIAPADYLPPVTEYLAPVEAAAADVDATESSPLGDDGYEYRTVRRLKLRHRRDVSHLLAAGGPARQYLPPSNLYLPPLPTVAPASTPAPVDDTEEVVSAAEPKVNREYLPPSTEEAPVEAATETAAPTEVPEVHSAQLLEDGYHYRQPNEQPAELREAAAAAAPREYLPPVAANDDDVVPPQVEAEDEEVVVVEGPANGESAVLTKDGYQYRRAVRRFRF